MALSVENLNYHVGQKQLLHGISATINTAQIIGIIGPNGAGKSTLLNCLTGLLLTTGKVKLNGRLIEQYEDHELAKVRAVLAQENHLNFPFKVRDIVGMSFAFSALSNQQQNELSSHCLALLSAEHLASRNFLSLSGGEKQRVHMARVLAQLLQHQPTPDMRLLFLDEPTAALDLKHQHQLFRHLKSLLQDNISVITVIHDLNLAAACCDQLWVMQSGQLVKQGDPNQVITEELMNRVFEVEVMVTHHDHSPHPVISSL